MPEPVLIEMARHPHADLPLADVSLRTAGRSGNGAVRAAGTDGLALHAAQRLLVDLGPDVAEHCQHVARLSLALFDGLQPLHRLDEETRVELACAALLHDIGVAVAANRHHKHRRDLIMQRFWVVPEERRRRIALIARYHRKALPDKRHTLYDILSKTERHAVWTALGCLRIADGLDRTHRALARGVHVAILPKSLEIRVDLPLAGREELAVARMKADGLATHFKRSVTITHADRNT